MLGYDLAIVQALGIPQRIRQETLERERALSANPVNSPNSFSLIRRIVNWWLNINRG